MKWIALSLLVACSPSVALVPSSMPFVRIDRSIAGAVCSREAAETIAVRRELERGEAAKLLVDCDARATLSGKLMDEANKRAETNSWWGNWGGTLLLGSALISLGAGFALGWGARR